MNSRTEALMMRNDIETCQQYSSLFNLLSIRNQEIYQYLMQDFGLLPEYLYKETHRLGHGNYGEVSQNNLEHVEQGLLLLSRLKLKLKGHWESPLPENFWDDVELAWIIHDIGEWGMNQDTPTYRKNDAEITSDDLDEQERARGSLRKITKRELSEKLVDLFNTFETRIEYDSEGNVARHNLLGCIVRCIDKWEASVFHRESGVIFIRQQKWDQVIYNHHIREDCFQKWITPCKVIAQYLDNEGKRKLKRLIIEEFDHYRNYHDGPLFTLETAREITNEILKVVSKIPGFKPEKENIAT